jgi:two-component system, OmpR family, response regulator RegX3
MTNARVLVVDDDPGILDVVSYALRHEGFDVETAEDVEQAERVLETPVDVVILDLMLPGGSGTDLCRRVRAAGNLVPILMLTARDAEVDRVVGLEAGADDYVTKPFSTAELVSRTRAMLRRREFDRTEGVSVRKVGDVTIDLTRYEVRVGDDRVALTPSEFRILTLLSERPGRVFSRREIMEHLWGSSHVGNQHACEVHISNLRKKIEGDPDNPQRLVTLRGFGYRLIAA